MASTAWWTFVMFLGMAGQYDCKLASSLDTDLVGPDLSVMWEEVMARMEAMYPNIRDEENINNNPLLSGYQLMSGGAGEGSQHLTPGGLIPNMIEVKTNKLVPAYCDPPNPCPVGYTARDGCIENAPNTPEFSRRYQSSQDCECDADHMFECAGDNTELWELNLMEEGDPEEEDMKQFSGIVAKKKAPSDRVMQNNPYLVGDQLPIVAKKTPLNK